MHGRQINPYDISHFVRCNTLVLISITHAAYNAIMRFTCNKKIEGGVAVCVHPSRRQAAGAGGFWSIDRGLALSCILKIWQFMWSASAISISDKVGQEVAGKLLNTFLKREREEEREWGELQEGGLNRLYDRRLRAVAVAQARFKFPGPLPPPPKSVYGSSLIKEHHKSVARAIVIMNLISIRAFI